MVATGTLLTFVVAALASLFMAWAIGAGSSGSTPFAAAVGANAISVMRAGFVVGLLGFAGAVLQGANVTEAVGTQLIGGVSLTATAAIVGLLTAAGLVAVGVFTGPTRAPRVPERYAISVLGALVGLLVATIEFSLLGPTGEPASIAATIGADLPVGGRFVATACALLVAAVLYYGLVTDPEAAQRRFLLSLGGLVAFSAGGSQVGLAIGPLVPLLDDVAVPLPAVLAGGGFGLLLGSWTGAPRMIKALAQDYSSLGPRRSIAALIPSFAIAQAAVAFGIPVSFNEIVVSAIIGSGYAAGGGGVSRRKLLYTVLAWIGSLLLALGVGYAVFTAFDALFA